MQAPVNVSVLPKGHGSYIKALVGAITYSLC